MRNCTGHLTRKVDCALHAVGFFNLGALGLAAWIVDVVFVDHFGADEVDENTGVAEVAQAPQRYCCSFLDRSPNLGAPSGDWLKAIGLAERLNLKTELL